MAFFSSGIVTNVDSAPDQQKLVNFGTQLDFRFALFSRLDATLSFRYAAAVEKEQRGTEGIHGLLENHLMIVLFFKFFLGLLPVLLLLAALVFLDSYKLVTLKTVLLTIVAGCVAVGGAFLVNTWLLEHFNLEITFYSWYIAPVLEEVL